MAAAVAAGPASLSSGTETTAESVSGGGETNGGGGRATKDPAAAVDLWPHDLAEIVDLKAASELNGIQARLIRLDTDAARWEVKLPDDTIKAIRPENLLFKALGPVEDDGTLMLIGMATDNVAVGSFLKSLGELIPKANGALQLVTHVVGVGGTASGEDAKLWLKLGRQAKQQLKCFTEDIQKHIETVDNIDVDKLGTQEAGGLKMARGDLIRFAQSFQDRLEAAMARLKPVLERLDSEAPAAAGARSHGWSKDDIDALAGHERYQQASDKRSGRGHDDEDMSDTADAIAAARAKLKDVIVKYQGKGDNPPPSDNLYVKNLPGWTTEADLEAIFAKVGEVKSMRLKNADWGAIAFVRLANQKETARAIRDLHGSVPDRLAQRGAEIEAERRMEVAAKTELGALVEQLERGVLVVVDLSRPLGVRFTNSLVADGVQDGSQAAELGLWEGWRARSIDGAPVSTADELVSKMLALKAKGAREAAISFSPPPIVVSCAERPFGIVIERHLELSLMVVSEAKDIARRHGVRPGAVLSMVADQEVSTMDTEEVVDLLKRVALPARLVFQQAQKLRPRKSPPAEAQAESNKRRRLAPSEKDEERTSRPFGAGGGGQEVDAAADAALAAALKLPVDLAHPLGILFDDTLGVEDVQVGSQAFRLGVRKGWKALALDQERFTLTDDLVARVQSLKARGDMQISISFMPGPLEVVFKERPFGFSVGFDEATCRFEVGSVGGAAEKAKVEVGMSVCSVGGHSVKRLRRTEDVLDLLLSATLPVAVVFEGTTAPALTALPTAAAEADAASQGGEGKRADNGQGGEALLPCSAVVVKVSLAEPLGIFFDDELLAQDVQEGAQAWRLGVRPGWRALSVDGESLGTTEALVARLQGLRAQGDVAAVDVAFATVPVEVVFEARPFGFAVGLDEALSQFVVGAVGGAAEAQGVTVGMTLTAICGHRVHGGQPEEEVIELLRQAPLPATVVFQQSQNQTT
eukprot:TRINITY_DN61091_c0_g1_i1.p1 TRINITY_DN61091_c0_g1~~TRINITY_DN61091_c0_g1_i1.p1  ORF type:complete len:981 (-),score=240.57 TRINITY_DN61091_c0_g1_i1:73-3015(-)